MQLKTVEELYANYITSVWKEEYNKLHPIQQQEMKRCFTAGFISATSELAKLHSESNAATILAVEAIKAIAKNNNRSVQQFKDWVHQCEKLTDVANLLVTERN